MMYGDWVERAEDDLDRELAEGMLTPKEYSRYLRELHQEAEEAGYYDSGYEGDY